MDFNFGGRMPVRRKRFEGVTGTIVDIVPARMGNRRAEGCMLFVTLEDMNGNTVNFIMTPATYLVDFETLSPGMACTFWYDTEAPMPLIYPPQYNAVAAAREKMERMVNVGYYNTALVNDDQTLQLNMDGTVAVRTTNNQYFQGNPAGHNLVVVYENSTRSIPAQTTPKLVVVLCEA